MSLLSFSAGQGRGRRLSHVPPASSAKFQVQAPTGAAFVQLPHYPFQPLPTPNGQPPFRFDLAHLLSADDVSKIKSAGTMVFHTVGDTGDFRGRQQDFVAEMMTEDSDKLPDNRKPAFFYHLGDVVYFAGDVDMYGDNYYETYKDYPGFIVAIAGNHDCQPDDPEDGPVDPNKRPLDGWVQNFMSKNPSQLGSLKTGSNRTQMDLPNVYWTFTTPLATIIGLFSNVGESEGEIHPDQVSWFQKELAAADPDLALIVTVHHPPFSGDTEHQGSSAVDKVLSKSFQESGRYPHLILSGHVHNYQRFTNVVQGHKGAMQIPCVVAGAGGYSKLSRLQKVNGEYPDPTQPLEIGNGLTLECYDQENFGFLRFEVSKDEIVGTYTSAPYVAGGSPAASVIDTFTIDIAGHTVTTGAGGSAPANRTAPRNAKKQPPKAPAGSKGGGAKRPKGGKKR